MHVMKRQCSLARLRKSHVLTMADLSSRKMMHGPMG